MAQYMIDNRPWPIRIETRNETMRIIQNCKNLLMCRCGDVPYDRGRGIDTRVLSQPIEQVRASLDKELGRVLMWEPDASLVSSTCSIDENGEIYIQMIVEIDGEVEDE